MTGAQFQCWLGIICIKFVDFTWCTESRTPEVGLKNKPTCQQLKVSRLFRCSWILEEKHGPATGDKRNSHPEETFRNAMHWFMQKHTRLWFRQLSFEVEDVRDEFSSSWNHRLRPGHRKWMELVDASQRIRMIWFLIAQIRPTRRTQSNHEIAYQNWYNFNHNL